MSKIVGHISQVIGPVVDVHFNLVWMFTSIWRDWMPKLHCRKYTMQ